MEVYCIGSSGRGSKGTEVPLYIIFKKRAPCSADKSSAITVKLTYRSSDEAFPGKNVKRTLPAYLNNTDNTYLVIII